LPEALLVPNVSILPLNPSKSISGKVTNGKLVERVTLSSLFLLPVLFYRLILPGEGALYDQRTSWEFPRESCCALADNIRLAGRWRGFLCSVVLVAAALARLSC
jgi:hypothetical protein